MKTNVSNGGGVTVTELVAPSSGVEYAYIIHLKTNKDRLQDNTTTSGRHLYGPSTILRLWYDDGGCNTVEFDYDPNATYTGLLEMCNRQPKELLLAPVSDHPL